MKSQLSRALLGMGLAVALALGFVVRQAWAAGPGSVLAAPGRWQVVNGTPQLTRNIMLLDTWTGATWQICSVENDATAWCAIPKTSFSGGFSRPPAEPAQP